ncbi:MAG: hypothetical protein MRY80_15870 [Oricola sp.]|nr:hypothetical protein [Oricola sp.]
MKSTSFRMTVAPSPMNIPPPRPAPPPLPVPPVTLWPVTTPLEMVVVPERYSVA